MNFAHFGIAQGLRPTTHDKNNIRHSSTNVIEN